MADVAEDMVGTVAGIIAERDVEARRSSSSRDDEEMDQLRRIVVHRAALRRLADGVEAAVDIALLGRYYERIADHAVRWPTGSSSWSPAQYPVDRRRADP